MLNTLLPFILRQAQVIVGPDVKVRITADNWIRMDHWSLPNTWAVYSPERWISIVGKEMGLGRETRVPVASWPKWMISAADTLEDQEEELVCLTRIVLTEENRYDN